MARIGLIAGAGKLPLEFIRSAKGQGLKVVVFAIQGMGSLQLEREADRIYWMKVSQYKKFAFLLLKERIKRIALVGKVDKKVIYDEGPGDKEYVDAVWKLDDRKDYSILEEITRHLKRIGVEVIDSVQYLAHLMPRKGILSRTVPDERIEEDINFGYDIARKLAGMDIGQTVVVKGKTVVAVEAMEGTDAAIKRGMDVAGEGCVMVKVSRPDQDLRWDIPTVGPDTVTRLSENRFSALAIESGSMFLLEKDRFVEMADAAGIVVKVI